MAHHTEQTVLNIIAKNGGDNHGNKTGRVYCRWEGSKQRKPQGCVWYLPDSITIAIVVLKSNGEDTMTAAARRLVR
jgi:hypothetical protein